MEAPKLEAPKTEFFLGYDYEHASTSGSKIKDSTNLNGFAFEFSHYLKKSNLGYIVDLAHSSNSRVDSTGIKYTHSSYMAGPSYRIHSVGFFTFNAHALAGVDHAQFSVPEPGTILYYRNTDLSLAGGVTVDGNLSRHLGVRVAQVDYIYTNHYSTNQGSFRYLGGVVIRF
jgi:hypothetical protein